MDIEKFTVSEHFGGFHSGGYKPKDCPECRSEQRLINAKRIVDREALGTPIRNHVLEDMRIDPDPRN